MKIRELMLRNFGMFQDKNIRFEAGMNVIYGENESGKSTIHSFMKGMLFGMERGRGRASVYDAFSIYEPWKNPNYYSGYLRFESGEKLFRVDRNFDKYSKKAELICEDDGEVLSVPDGDLEMLLDGMTVSGYDNTVSIGQLKVQPEKCLGLALQKYANEYYASGNGELRTEQALALLRGKKKEAERAAAAVLEQKQQVRERLEQEVSYVWRDIHRLEEELEQLEERLRQKEQTKKKQDPDEKKGLMDSLRPSKWRIHPLEILLLAALVILAMVFLDRPINFFAAVVVFLAGGLYVWNRMKVSKKSKTVPESIMEEILPEKEGIPAERLKGERDRVRTELRDKQIQYENLKEQAEELNETGEAYDRYEQKIRAIQMAMDRIRDLSADCRERMEQELNRKASWILKEITAGKYDRLLVEENLHMTLLKEGKRIAVEQVSRGTAEQIYFALRMAAADILEEEELPVILDDCFGNYDDERLKRVLDWLWRHKKQVILFTCQNREMRILKNLGIPYSEIKL